MSAANASIRGLWLHLSQPIARSGSGGGRLLLGLSVLVFFVGGAAFNALGLLSEAIAASREQARETVLSATSAFLLAFYIAGPISAALLGRIPKHWVFAMSALLAALGYVWLTHAENIGSIAGALALAGAGVGGATVVPAIALLGRRYRRDIGFAVGIVIAAGAAGASLFPPLIGSAIAILGWHAATLGLAGMIVTISALAITILATIDDVLPKERAPSAFREYRNLVAALADRRFWAVSIATSLAQLGVMGVYVSFVPFLVARGYPLVSSGFYFGAMNLFSAIGCVLVGIAADRRGAHSMMVFAMISNAVCMLLLLSTAIGATTGVVIAFVIVWGIVQGAPYQLGPVLLAADCPTDLFGQLSGVMMLMVGVVSSFGPILFGSISAQAGELAAVLACGGLMVLPLPLLFVRPARGGIVPDAGF